jgi:hypothetical protein
LSARGLVDEVQPNVLRLVGAPISWRQEVMAACLSARGVASHRSSRCLHDLDRPSGITPVELTVERRIAHPLAGAIVHRVSSMPPADVVVVDGIPVTNIARTLCDLGAVVSMDDVERALDDALRRGCSQRWIDETLARLDRPGPSGTGTLRRVLDLNDRRGALPGSWLERVLERVLSHPELAGLVRQHEIRRADGSLIARPDLALPDVRLGIEFHSDQWHFGPRRGRRDRKRDLAAARVGWQLAYLDASDLADAEAAVAAIVDVVRERRRFVAGTGA